MPHNRVRYAAISARLTPPSPRLPRTIKPARNALLADVATPAVYGKAYGFERAMDNLGAIGDPLLALGLVASIGRPLFQRFCRWRVTVHLTAALVGPPIHFQRVPPDLRQGLRAEVLVVRQLQLLFLFLFFTPPADPNIAHARRLVLELVGARLVRIELLGHQNVLVAVNGNTGLLIRLVDPGAISKLDRRRRVPLGVVWNVPPRLC